MLGVTLNRLFSIKCLFRSSPNIFLFVLIVVIVYCYAFMIKVIEGPVYAQLGVKDLVDYSLIENCIWTICVTMTSGKSLKNENNLYN
jgi:hypothetical protein